MNGFRTYFFIGMVFVIGSKEDSEAMDMLVGNAQSLMMSVSIFRQSLFKIIECINWVSLMIIVQKQNIFLEWCLVEHRWTFVLEESVQYCVNLLLLSYIATGVCLTETKDKCLHDVHIVPRYLVTVTFTSTERDGNSRIGHFSAQIFVDHQIQEVVKAAAGASVKIMSQRGPRLRWVRKNYYWTHAQVTAVGACLCLFLYPILHISPSYPTLSGVGTTDFFFHID